MVAKSNEPYLFLVVGNSGSGKDTVADVLPAINVKFAAPGKRALEQIYGLTSGFLDDRALRQQVAPHSGGKTYLDVLIDLWEHRSKIIGPDLFPQQVAKKIGGYLENSLNVVVTDLRSKEELQVIYDAGATIVVIQLNGGTPLKSDNYLPEALRALECWYSIGEVDSWYEFDHYPGQPEKLVEKVRASLGAFYD